MYLHTQKIITNKNTVPLYLIVAILLFITFEKQSDMINLL